MRPRGFSLVELILCMLLFIVVGSMGILSLYKPTGTAETRSAAEVLAAELRATRSRAIAQGHPVALVFPSAGGSNPCTRSFYLLEGDVNPRIIRVQGIGGEFPKTCYLNAVWPLNGSLLQFPAQGNSRDPIRTGSQSDLFDFGAWGAPNPRDYHIIFLPNGTVTTNSLPNFDGAYHVVVCQAPTVGGSAPPPGAAPTSVSYYSPSRLGNPNTVAVSSLGEVLLLPGLAGNDTVATVDRPGPLGAVALPPAMSGNANAAPQITDLKSFTAPITSTLPSGTGATVGEDGYLSATVTAQDADGDPLWVRWEATGGAGSHVVDSRLEYEPGVGWVGHWNWMPPAGGMLWGPFDLQARVLDRRGGQDVRPIASVPAVRPVGGGKIIYSAYDSASSRYELFTINLDGSGKHRLLRTAAQQPAGVHFLHATWSPDGTKVAFEDIEDNLYLANADGTNLRAVSANYRAGQFPVWSKDSNHLYFAGVDRRIWRMNADGSGLLALTSGANPAFYFSVDRNETTLVFTHQIDVTPNHEMWVVDLATGVETQATNSPEAETEVCFSPQRDELLLRRGTFVAGDLYVREPPYTDGCPERRLTTSNPPTWEVDYFGVAPWSPDGEWLMFAAGPTDGQREVYTLPRLGGAPTMVSGGAGGACGSFTAPDGASLAIIGFGGSPDIFSVSRDGSNRKRITFGAGDDNFPIWKP